MLSHVTYIVSAFAREVLIKKNLTFCNIYFLKIAKHIDNYDTSKIFLRCLLAARNEYFSRGSSILRENFVTSFFALGKYNCNRLLGRLTLLHTIQQHKCQTTKRLKYLDIQRNDDTMSRYLYILLSIYIFYYAHKTHENVSHKFFYTHKIARKLKLCWKKKGWKFVRFRCMKHFCLSTWRYISCRLTLMVQRNYRMRFV